MKRYLITVLGLLLSSHVFAAEIPTADYAREGFYIGVGGGYAFQDIYNDVDRSTSDFDSVDNSSAINARLGYRFSKHLSAEAGFQYLLGFTATHQRFSMGVSLPRITDDIVATVVTANVNAYVLTDRIQPYFTVGLGLVHLAESDLGKGEEQLGFCIGGGLDIYITRQFALATGVRYVHHRGEFDAAENFRYVSVDLGALWRF